jgi:hypothetical protein
MAAAIDQRADLSTGFVRQFGKLAREFRRQNLVRSNPPRIELFYSAKLIRLEARGVSYYVLDITFPPSTQTLKSPLRWLERMPIEFRFRAEITG